MTKKRLVYGSSLICMAVSVYLVYGYHLMSAIDPYRLTYYAIAPSHFAIDTRYPLPFVTQASRAFLNAYAGNELREFFEQRQLQPYSVIALGNVEGTTKSKRIAREIATWLLENGIELSMLDKYGCSSLHNAALQGDQDAIDFLIARGASAESNGNSFAVIAACREPASLLLTERRG